MRRLPGEYAQPERVGDGELRQTPHDKSRLTLALLDLFERSLGLCGGRRFYRHMYLRGGRFRVRREEVQVPGLPSGLEGLSIAHLSDLHAGSLLRGGDLSDVVRHVNELEVDLVALTGDYVTHHASAAVHLTRDLAELRSRWGTFAVLGNHDYRRGREHEVIAHLEGAGVRFLRNRGVRLDSGSGVLYLSGLEDLEQAAHIDPRGAREGLLPGDVEVLLCHNPAAARHLAREGCAVMLSGHTHGGQLNVPVIPGLGPCHPGDRLQHGPTACIVSRGLGAVAVPLRFRSPAECVVVTLRNLSESSRPPGQDDSLRFR